MTLPDRMELDTRRRVLESLYGKHVMVTGVFVAPVPALATIDGCGTELVLQTYAIVIVDEALRRGSRSLVCDSRAGHMVSKP
jgi:hypothetical protein